jgi:hypothetical protein
VHRRSRFASRFPGRFRARADALQRRGVALTYVLHERLLSNRRSRALLRRHPAELDDVQTELLEQLRRQGYALTRVERLLPDPELRREIEARADAFRDNTLRGLAGEPGHELRQRPGKEFLVRKYSWDVALGLDEPWLAACLSERMLALANAYLGLWSKLSYVDYWYTPPAQPGAERRSSQVWHRDFDDRHLLKAFLYLDDVDSESGPFELVPGSQPGGPLADVAPWGPLRIEHLSDEELERRCGAGAAETFTGPRGTLILCNTCGLHRGGFAERKPRLLATATYCSPASLAALSVRSYSLREPEALEALPAAARYAAT